MRKTFFLLIFVMFIVIDVTNAEVMIRKHVEINCLFRTRLINDVAQIGDILSGRSSPKKYFHPGEPKTQLSITLDGIWAEGFTDDRFNGLVIGTLKGYVKNGYVDIWKSMSPENQNIVMSMHGIQVDAQCVAAGAQPMFKGIGLEIGQTFSCPKGEGLSVKYSAPECVSKDRVDRKAVLTLTVMRDDDEQNALVAQAVTQQDMNGVLQGRALPNGNGMQAARATPENETATAQTTNGPTENTGLVGGQDTDAPGDKRSCCLWLWSSS